MAATLVACGQELPASTSCSVRVLNHDATLVLTGPLADNQCSVLIQRSGGQWTPYSGQVTGDVVCSGTFSVTSSGQTASIGWVVYDTGFHQIGQQLCTAMNQYVPSP